MTLHKFDFLLSWVAPSVMDEVVAWPYSITSAAHRLCAAYFAHGRPNNTGNLLPYDTKK